jgi:uncharacterized membrane protein YfcA
VNFPHPGPNISRIRLEGAGGFIYALTPLLILLFTAPLLLGGAVFAGALVAVALHWMWRRHPVRAGLVSAIPSLLGILILAFVLGTHPLFRAFVCACTLGGLAVAVRLHHARRTGRELSIRRYAGE